MPDNGAEKFRFRSLYLDTSVLIKENWPRASTRLENVLLSARDIGVAVYLPEVVRREHESHWLRGYDEKREKLQEHLLPLKKHLDRLPAERMPPMAIPSREDVETCYRESIKESEQKWGIGAAAIPELRTADILNMAIKREVVFDDGGKNFQDAIIYLSVLEHLKQTGLPPSAFVSADGIFEARASDLQKLAVAAGVEIRLYSKLEQIEEELISRRTESERDLIQTRKQCAMEGAMREIASIQEWLSQNLVSLGGLREKYPAVEFRITVTRVTSAEPALAKAEAAASRVRIAVEVEAEISGALPRGQSLQSARLNRALGFGEYRSEYRQYAYLQPATNLAFLGGLGGPTVPPDEFVAFGTDIIEIESEAMFDGVEFRQFTFRTAQLKRHPMPYPRLVS